MTLTTYVEWWKGLTADEPAVIADAVARMRPIQQAVYGMQDLMTLFLKLPGRIPGARFEYVLAGFAAIDNAIWHDYVCLVLFLSEDAKAHEAAERHAGEGIPLWNDAGRSMSEAISGRPPNPTEQVLLAKQWAAATRSLREAVLVPFIEESRVTQRDLGIVLG